MVAGHGDRPGARRAEIFPNFSADFPHRRR